MVHITEQIDGTNGLIQIEQHQFGASIELEHHPDPTIVGYQFDPKDVGGDGLPDYEYWFRAGSRTRWVTPKADNHGFALWVFNRGRTLLADLGPGNHYGEFWGAGINRAYGLKNDDRRFSLFNSQKWKDHEFTTPGLATVPLLISGNAIDLNLMVADALSDLEEYGSYAVDGFPNPEGIVVYHEAANTYFKATIHNDDVPKSVVA